MNRAFVTFFLILCVVFGVASTAAAADKLPVFVSIVPQKFFVQQIGKDLVDVQAMVQPGASPATYEPKPRQMAALSGAKIYFSIGVPFEKAWLDKIAAANPQMTVVHTDDGIEKIPMAAHHHHEDHAGKDGEEKHHADDHEKGHHGHTGLDPHIWLSPPLVRIQARTITTALQTADPAHRDVYDANFRDFAGRIDQLDNDLRDTLAGRFGMSFMVFHPAWGYFAHAYGLKQMPIEIEGKDPKPARLQALIEHAREHNIHVIFVQPQFSTKSAELIAREIDGQVVAANPLAEDWMANLRQVADKFKAALK
ncbi:metal ABC transporter solute-binding protein, Zn/Mn family [uncultured Desulfosarcina sp.]|uniref:metal ABC transporter solute-binding protein, Zn/Mn family n=1 Tax=uncultured Desulfosarcina sp. TaxID=218289 RepID=UPI0029C92CA6|nr:zinc ABC transporter substrate-binding protein [uncultured Desulfosarcina sp.]